MYKKSWYACFVWFGELISFFTNLYFVLCSGLFSKKIYSLLIPSLSAEIGYDLMFSQTALIVYEHPKNQ